MCFTAFPQRFLLLQTPVRAVLGRFSAHAVARQFQRTQTAVRVLVYLERPGIGIRREKSRNDVYDEMKQHQHSALGAFERLPVTISL